MKREQAVEFVQELVQAINAHDAARMLSFYAPDAVAHTPAFPEITGRTAIGENFETLFSLFPDWTVELNDVLVDGDRIAFTGIVHATDRNGWFGQAPTGEKIEYRAMIVLQVASGKIVRDERIYDLAGVLQRLEKSRLDRELRMAAEVQRALLPRSAFSTSFCQAVADSIPCRTIGGDFFDLIQLPSGSLGIALGDVAGKGPASALLGSMLQGMLAAVVEKESSPANVVRALNRLLIRRGLEPSFVTLVYGVLSPEGEFAYTNAGHIPPMLLAKGGIRRLTAGGPVLGLMPEVPFEEETLALYEGDTLILFSDGVTEARNREDLEFAEDRLISCITARSPAQISDILSGILTGVHEFCEGASQADDITAMVLRFQHLRGNHSSF